MPPKRGAGRGGECDNNCKEGSPEEVVRKLFPHSHLSWFSLLLYDALFTWHTRNWKDSFLWNRAEHEGNRTEKKSSQQESLVWTSLRVRPLGSHYFYMLWVLLGVWTSALLSKESWTRSPSGWCPGARGMKAAAECSQVSGKRLQTPGRSAGWPWVTWGWSSHTTVPIARLAENQPATWET